MPRVGFLFFSTYEKEFPMKGLVIVLLLVVIGVGVLGYYRGWFSVQESKIGEDKEKVREILK